MPYLKYITDQALISIVKELISTAGKAIISAKEHTGRNVIDPFSVVFEMAGFNLTHEQWLKNEQTRQAQKTLTNSIGMFHQKILGNVSGWKDLAVGEVVDLECRERKIIAEIKNKFNTMSGGKLAGLYEMLEERIMPKGQTYKGFTAYYVEIVPKTPKRYNTAFIPSDNKTSSQKPINELIRRIDGYSFYEIATGREKALEELFSVLPDVITECTEGKYRVMDTGILLEIFSKAYLGV